MRKVEKRETVYSASISKSFSNNGNKDAYVFLS